MNAKRIKIPTSITVISGKRHKGESLDDFRKRCKKCNARRREREGLKCQS